MHRTLLALPVLLLLAGCWTPHPRYVRPSMSRCRPMPPPTVVAPTPTPERESALYAGETGRALRLGQFLTQAADADLVVFGELHGHPVGATYEKLVLQSLTASRRPVALAMEFFERDQQPKLDDYLAGKLDAETFKKDTKRNKAYDATHGVLVEWAKEHGIPVIAANSPRRLVSAYRKSDAEDYAAYLASLSEEERTWLPAETSLVRDAYWERFEKLMGKKAEGFFKSQSLWDDSMAESMASFRDAHPEHRILFVVGAFHVTEGLGTITKYLQRRPGDTVATLVMTMDKEPSLPFAEEDRGQGDAVLKVHPPKRKRPMGPNPHARPSKPKASPEAAPPRS